MLKVSKFLTFALITYGMSSAMAQLGSGAINHTEPMGSGPALTPTSSVSQPSGGSGQATTSEDVIPPLTGKDPAGLNTATGTDLTPTQGQQSQLPADSVNSPLPSQERTVFPEIPRQAEEVDFSTLPAVPRRDLRQ